MVWRRNMKKHLGLVVGIAVLALVLSAGAVFAGSKAGKMFVVIDRGIDSSMDERQVKSRDQVGDWMETDLLRLLEKAGFDAQLIRERSEYKTGEGNYLLKVKITDYNPGSKAARIVVGFGAGATSMKTHYELFSGGSSPIHSDDLGVGSGRDWRNVIRKIDEQTVKGVKENVK
jgi:hypothetical protein